MTKLREKESATTVLFCRHGTTDYPEDRFYPNESGGGFEYGGGPGLNSEGQLQAQRLAKYIGALDRVKVLYVSPTLRTRQTLEAILQETALSAVILPELREREMGEWDGCSAEEVRTRDPDGWTRWKSDPLMFTPPGGESLLDFSRRVTQAIQGILEKEAGRTLAVITHAGLIRVATAMALGIPLENCKRLIVGPASVTWIEYTRSWPNLVLFGYQP